MHGQQNIKKMKSPV